MNRKSNTRGERFLKFFIFKELLDKRKSLSIPYTNTVAGLALIIMNRIFEIKETNCNLRGKNIFARAFLHHLESTLLNTEQIA